MFDFTPNGHACRTVGSARDGWSAYTRWLRALKVEHRKGPRSVYSLSVEQKKALGDESA
ncbi:MAG: hypothetical protein AAGA68_08755 [Pseudomonadota bacterium]